MRWCRSGDLNPHWFPHYLFHFPLVDVIGIWATIPSHPRGSYPISVWTDQMIQRTCKSYPYGYSPPGNSRVGMDGNVFPTIPWMPPYIRAMLTMALVACFSRFSHIRSVA